MIQAPIKVGMVKFLYCPFLRPSSRLTESQLLGLFPHVCVLLSAHPRTLHSPASWTSVTSVPTSTTTAAPFSSQHPLTRLTVMDRHNTPLAVNTETSLKCWIRAGWFSSVLFVMFLFAWRELTSKTNHFLFHFTDLMRPKLLCDVHFCLSLRYLGLVGPNNNN